MEGTITQYKQRLESYKEQLEAFKNKKLVEETNLKNLEERESELLQEIKSLGINPRDLKQTILDKQIELKEVTAKLDSLIPRNGIITESYEKALDNYNQGIDELEDDILFDD